MIFDILIIILIAYFVNRGHKAGFVRSILRSFANVVAILSSFILAKRYSDLLSEKVISPIFENYILTVINEKINYHELLETITDSATIDNSFINYFLDLSQTQISSIISLDVSNAFSYLEQLICQNIMHGIAYVIIFLISMMVVTIAFNMMLKFVDFMLKITLLSPLNKLLGAIFGALFAIIVAYLLIWGLYLVLPIEIFSENTADSTIINLIMNYKIDNFVSFIK